MKPSFPVSVVYCLIVLGTLCFAPAVRTQEISEDLYSTLKWRMIGPFRAGKVNAVAGVPGNSAVYYFGADGGGVWKTTDGGSTWKPIFDSQPVGSIGALALAPSNPNIIYVGSGVNGVYSDIAYGNGVYKSADGGETWQHIGLEDTRHIARILIDPRNPDIVLIAALGHSFGPNEERGVFRSTDGGKTWKKVLYKDNLTGAVDLCFEPGNSRVVYATLWQGIRKPGQKGTSFGPGSGLYKSVDGGVTWSQITGHGLPAGDWGRSGVAVAAGMHGRRVYLIVEAKEKAGGLYRSDDAGATWQRATKDRRIDGYWYMSEIFADPNNPEVVYVPIQSLYRSTDGGRTKDGGATWKNVTPPDVSAWSSVSVVEPSHFDAAAAYAAVNRNGLDDLRPHILRTRDFGQTWKEAVNGIRDIDFVRTVREDPVRKGLLYAGTEESVYVSLDDGDRWHSLRLNMPVVAVHDLAVEQDDLVAATYGRSFWILDDVSPLRHLDSRFSASENHLLPPRSAIRVRRDENQDTPLPPEVPAGKNPPNGAILHYYLADPSGDIQLEIYDSAGALIKSYSSAPVPPEKEKDDPFIAAYWIAHLEPLGRDKGMHRFVWNLRYTDPPAIHVQSPYNYPIAAIVGDTPLPPEGPLVMPGTYEVRLKVGEQVLRRPLEVKMDPRVSYVRNELQSSLDLQLKISAALARNFVAYQQVKDLRARLADLRNRPKGDLATAASTLDAKLAELEGEPTPILEEPKTVSFSAVNDTLVALMVLVDGADSAPSEESFAAYHRTCKGLNTTLEAWQAIKSKDLRAFSATLSQNKIAPMREYVSLGAIENCGN